MAIAVAPVTNWRFYDNIYTERYMGLPSDNGDGYDADSPLSHVDGLQGKYLLIHGTGDDNVHVQNSMRMVEALVQADKDFDWFAYPDKKPRHLWRQYHDALVPYDDGIHSGEFIRIGP
jgi:dipeptidyl-peptidase-4